jgi:hypothetical protein
MKTALTILLAIGCGKDESIADGVWKVTVSNKTSHCETVLDYGAQADDVGLDDICGTNCEGAKANIGQDYRYALFTDGRSANIKIDDQQFASGVEEGCTLSYQTPVWLETRAKGDVQWSIQSVDTLKQGDATCSELDGKYDWVGFEVITVVESEDPDLVPGCTYGVAVVGKYEGAGE